MCYYYSSRYGKAYRLIDPVIGKVVCDRPQEGGHARPPTPGHVGKPQGQPDVEGARENVHKGLYCGFHGKARARPGKKA